MYFMFFIVGHNNARIKKNFTSYDNFVKLFVVKTLFSDFRLQFCSKRFPVLRNPFYKT